MNAELLVISIHSWIVDMRNLIWSLILEIDFSMHGLTKTIFLNEDISNKLYLAEVRALGIADKIVTGPFWRIVENVDNMLEINPYLIQLKVSLSSLSVDASPIFRGEEVFSKS